MIVRFQEAAVLVHAMNAEIAGPSDVQAFVDRVLEERDDLPGEICELAVMKLSRKEILARLEAIAAPLDRGVLLGRVVRLARVKLEDAALEASIAARWVYFSACYHDDWGELTSEASCYWDSIDLAITDSFGTLEESTRSFLGFLRRAETHWLGSGDES